jgi:anti-sigma regulatory factor (Ser/Thr protein kinase)
MEAALMLAPAPSSAAAARALVQGTLPDWGCDQLVDDARIVVTELVSNVIRHAHTDLEVVLEVHSDALRVAVTDGAAGSVRVRESDPHTGIGGRGLRIVEELSDRWGIEPTDDGGKTVWAEWLLPH